MSSGSQLPDGPLKNVLLHETMGAMALDPETILLLWRELWADRPNVIVECGSGVSTLALAAYSRQRQDEGDAAPLIISLEQDQDIKKGVDERLRRADLENQVQVFYAPLSDSGVYTLASDELENALASRKLDWILIDGPAGYSGVRRHTLSLFQHVWKVGTRWFLDDAFRDGELEVLREWSVLPGLRVRGIYPVGKGLATGDIVDLQLSSAR